MIKQKLLDLFKEHQGKFKEFKVQRMFLFGSVARGQETPSSDIDILIKFEIPPTYDMYMDLKFFLEDLLVFQLDVLFYVFLPSMSTNSSFVFHRLDF